MHICPGPMVGAFLSLAFGRIIRGAMPIPDYQIATTCLQENLRILMDQHGNVRPEDRALWNFSNALIVVLDALQNIESRLRRIEN